MSGTPGYPRPQLVRDSWFSLNGRWDFALDRDGRWPSPDDVAFDRTIVVTTGIWQTVWLEILPPSAIATIGWTPNLERWELGLDVRIDLCVRRDPRGDARSALRS